jgi:hypothetical protein
MYQRLSVPADSEDQYLFLYAGLGKLRSELPDLMPFALSMGLINTCA